MSQSAFPRSKYVAIAMTVLVVAGVIAVAVLRLGGDDAEPRAAATQTTSAAPTTPTPTPEQTTSSPTPSPTPTPTSTASCEGPDTIYNEDGTEQDSLLPDCGIAPVTQPEQEKSGLSLACGGSYPVILYKTTTTGAKTSICGRDSSGADFRLVTQPKGGGPVVDLKGTYESQLDAFVAKDGSTTYSVQAYDGTLLVDKGGRTSKQKSSDWISLDNEPDSD
ncbi:hypothetical protein [Aeromicrobium endophyticum]|uniref:Uncharacterized protein n=1 Tax=Aeromicrobium endophyticum TaxID=2292704 RepID=A0A371P8R4_9ACTN|nr:hypothetical protein [Aeromicrobium endophyticum]REK72321.1 hypothetical protein DX116_01385 [Aeromicrobium endophyticum]